MTQPYPAEAVERLKATMTCLYPTTPDPDCSAAIALCDPADLAALLSYVEGMKWRPIESAPKDGTRLMLAKIVGHPANPTALWWACAGLWSDRWNNWNDGVEPCGLAGPTHWLPLPPPPDREG